MIGSVTGKIAYLGEDFCLLETAGGVGYRVFMPGNQLGKLVLGNELRALTYTAVREDAILLYGFLDQETYELFTMLLGVSGVGPKGANGICSAISPESFYLAIQSRDMKVLTKLPGIGKKTAERLILELKDKVGSMDLDPDGDDSAFVAAVSGTGSDNVNDAVEALASLGYANSEILPVIRKIKDYKKLSSEDIIRQALKLFAK